MSAEVNTSPDRDTVFKQLAEYNWDKDKEYQGGLSAILGPSPLPSQIYDLTLRAQCFYMSRKKGIPIDFDAYKVYLSSNTAPPPPPHTTINPTSTVAVETTPSSTAPLTQESQTTTTSQLEDLSLDDPTTQEPIPSPPQTQTHPPLTGSWQHPLYNPPPSLTTRPPPAALTSYDLLSPSTLPPPSAPIKTTYADPSTAPYPSSFPEIIALIQSGAPIPGIKDISQETLWGQGGEQTVRARRKPWEMHLSEEEVQVGAGGGVFGDRRDEWIGQELPDDEEEGKGKGRMPPPKPVPDWRGLKKVEERVPDWQVALGEKK